MECSICLCYARDVRICPQLSCSHAFHVRCINRWLTDEQGKTRPDAGCPVCRAPCWSNVLRPPETAPVAGWRVRCLRWCSDGLHSPSQLTVLTALYLGGVCARFLLSLAS